jgi:hypothetical protein
VELDFIFTEEYIKPANKIIVNGIIQMRFLSPLGLINSSIVIKINEKTINKIPNFRKFMLLIEIFIISNCFKKYRPKIFLTKIYPIIIIAQNEEISKHGYLIFMDKMGRKTIKFKQNNPLEQKFIVCLSYSFLSHFQLLNIHEYNFNVIMSKDIIKWLYNLF